MITKETKKKVMGLPSIQYYDRYGKLRDGWLIKKEKGVFWVFDTWGKRKKAKRIRGIEKGENHGKDN